MIELVKQDFEVFAVCPKGNYFDKFKEFGIKSIDYEIERDSLNPFKEIKTIFNISKVLKQIQPDILHTFTHKPNIYGTIAGKIAGIETILNLIEGLGSFYVENSPKSMTVRYLINNLYKITFRFSKKCIFVNSDDPSYYLSKNITSKKKIKIIKSVGVDTNFFKPMQKPSNLLKTFGLNTQKPIVLMIARVIKDKGVLEYIEAAEILKEKAQFIYVGDIDKGNKNAFLPDWKSVKWLGFQKNIKEIIALSDIVVLPSYREGVPRTLLEAGSMGKPLIATKVAGCKEVVKNNFNGFLVPTKNPIELAKAIEKLLNSRQLRELFGKNSREYVKSNFDIKIVVSKYIELYESVLNS